LLVAIDVSVFSRTNTFTEINQIIFHRQGLILLPSILRAKSNREGYHQRNVFSTARMTMESSHKIGFFRWLII
jgi:hypothetical protein